MEKIDLDYLRKHWKELARWNWDSLHKEIIEYFEMIKNTLYRKAKEELDKPEEEVLRSYDLTKETLKDPLFLPEILTFLEDIKENNFNLFPSNWVSDHYHHYDHAYFIKNTLIPELSPIAEMVKDFKISQYNQFYKKDAQIILPEDNFIEKDFKTYGLNHYDSYVDIINSVAYHTKYYVILPILLRCLFENLIHDILSNSLGSKHKDLYFNKAKRRRADFSLLIELLNQLCQYEYKGFIGDKINITIINILKDIKDIGNLSVHDVLRKITLSYTKENQDKINLVLESLLVSFDLLENKKIEIEPDRLKIIKEKLGIKNKLTPKVIEQKTKLENYDFKKYEFIQRIISLLRRYETIKNIEREEMECTQELGELFPKLVRIKFVKESNSIIKNKYYEVVFKPLSFVDKFLIRTLEKGKRSQNSKAFFSKEYPQSSTQKSDPQILYDFIKYLVNRIKQLGLNDILEEIKEEDKVGGKFSRLRNFIDYIFSEDYINQDERKIRKDERIISELNWIKRNENELNEYFTIFRRKDEPDQYNKILSFLNGEILIHFRNHKPFDSSLEINGDFIKFVKKEGIKENLRKLLENIKLHVKKNFNIQI